jgi:hypothetical protein
VKRFGITEFMLLHVDLFVLGFLAARVLHP